jgi:predicted secreted protein
MFDDARSKKIVLVAHCLLNQNSISDGTADRASQFDEIVEFLTAHHIGMIQMPCPEFVCLGLDRGDAEGSKRPLLQENTRIRESLGEPRHVATLRRKAEDLVTQTREYEVHGFQVLGVIGVDRSPSCGVATTSRAGAEEPGKGVFLELLFETLADHEITLPMIGTKTHEPEPSLEKVKRLVAGL